MFNAAVDNDESGGGLIFHQMEWPKAIWGSLARHSLQSPNAHSGIRILTGYDGNIIENDENDDGS